MAYNYNKGYDDTDGIYEEVAERVAKIEAAIKNGETDEATAPASERRTFYPTCRFCGKQTFPDAEYESQEIADEAATLHCNCAEGFEYRYEAERAKKREENITKLRQSLDDFSEYTEARGLTLEGDLYDLLLTVGIAVLDNKIEKATLDIVRFKVKFSVGIKSALSIAFTYSDGAKLEV